MSIPDPPVVTNYNQTSIGPKNIVINFDGTGGIPQWALQTDMTLYKNVGGMSNIGKLHLMAGGNIGNSNLVFEDQIAIYYQGVGTRGKWQGLKGAFGLGTMADIYEAAYEDLEKIYKDGDRIYIFGFSRGAATARLFASYLQKNNINGVVPKVAFLGVFDTVVESLAFGTSEDIKCVDVDRKSSSLPNIVEKAVHFVSIDDNRNPFKPTLFNEDSRVTEIWCPGIHSDVGGAYYHDGLSDITLECMRIEAEKAGMKFREITKETTEKEPSTLFDDKLVETKKWTETSKANFLAFDKDLSIDPDPSDPDVHDEIAFYPNKFLYSTLNFVSGYKCREVRKMKDDKKVTGEPILLLDSTISRANTWKAKDTPTLYALSAPYVKNTKYRPDNLKGIPYKLVKSEDMTVSDTTYNGIEENIEGEW